MSSRKVAAAASAQCAHCQRHLLHSFISSFAPALRPGLRASTSSIPTRSLAPRFQPLRNIHSSPLRCSSDQVPTQAQGDSGLNTSDDGQPEESKEQAPWYMQVHDEKQSAIDTNPFSERQRLPDLPDDPPPALQDILNHLSIDIGLDYLSLLDLRSLDPPPALGSNLIMIFGSARSERHLNVSADRFCRWLRTNYKLTPIADGLLGRNELKLKLKRKAKRSRMLGAYGAREAADYDDGTHTGWICVDVGTIENGPLAAATQRAEQQNIIGFGTGASGARLVVQVLTEGKRGDLDLEGLWQGFIRRAARKAQRESEEDDFREEETIEIDPAYASAAARSNTSHPLLTSSLPATETLQVRRFHTSARRLEQSVPQSPSAPEFPNIPFQPSIMGSSGSIPELGSYEALHAHIEYLCNLSQSSAIAALGESEDDQSSTLFLSSFFANIPECTSVHHHELLLSLHQRALNLKHPGYSKAGLMRKFNDMLLSGHLIPSDLFARYFQNFLFHEHNFAKANAAPQPGGEYNGRIALQRSLGFAFEVFEKMEAYGYDPYTDEIMKYLHHGISWPRFPKPATPASQSTSSDDHDSKETADDKLEVQTKSHIEQKQVIPAKPTSPNQPDPISTTDVRIELPTKQLREMQYRARKSILAIRPNPSDELILSILANYGKQQAWSHFWDTWRIPPSLGRGRRRGMYTCLFTYLTASNAQAKVREVMREKVDEMRLEEPPIVLGGKLVPALAECLLVAAPDGRDPWWVRLREEVDAAVAAQEAAAQSAQEADTKAAT